MGGFYLIMFHFKFLFKCPNSISAEGVVSTKSDWIKPISDCPNSISTEGVVSTFNFVFFNDFIFVQIQYLLKR